MEGKAQEVKGHKKTAFCILRYSKDLLQQQGPHAGAVKYLCQCWRCIWSE
jgi:hypothetical protein